MAVGIICEYNSFHNGHLYHLKKVKEMFPNDTIILVTNSYFTQRGDISVVNKWDKTKLCLDLGIDLVVELPFVFATQSADVFARGSIEILNALKVDKLVFGSESNDIELLKNIASIKKYEIKKYLNLGYSYPKSIGLFLENKGILLTSPNDILGVCYIKEIKRLKSKIEPICIKRTNDYHSTKLSKVTSATAIRKALYENKNIDKFVPKECLKYIDKHFIDEFFNTIKYKILTTDISKYQTVDEGIEYRLKKYIISCNNLEEFINMVKTKRYTYNKIKRMLIHILCEFTKIEAKNLELEYIRILGFNNKGKKYLNKIKKEIDIPIITKYKKFKNLDIEIRSTYVYASLLNRNELIKREYKKIIIKE